MENLSPEEGRGFRHRKKQTDPIFCPVCGITIRSSEIEQHYAIEIDRLIKLQLNQKFKKTLNNGTTYHDPLPGCSSNGNSNNESSGCPWITFQKIRNNRHSRLRIKAKKRKPDEPICPICNEHPTEDINAHVEMCLRKNENSNKSNGGTNTTNTSDDDDESIDIEGESYEEYEWAGQKRIRASSLLEGGYSGVGLGITITSNHNNGDGGGNDGCDNDNDEDEDLNVDGDDLQIYGPAQYSERDVILPSNEECDNNENSDIYLRRLVTGQDIQITTSSSSTSGSTGITNSLNQNHVMTTISSVGSGIIQSNAGDQNNSNNNNNNKTIIGSSSHKIDELHRHHHNNSLNNDNNSHNNYNNNNSHIIESLKNKIREYENQINNKIKCLICMDEFRKPAVSICCWHVHCEECWLRTLGARKLCPQCNMITSPSDLRRIYM